MYYGILSSTHCGTVVALYNSIDLLCPFVYWGKVHVLFDSKVYDFMLMTLILSLGHNESVLFQVQKSERHPGALWEWTGRRRVLGRRRNEIHRTSEYVFIFLLHL